MRGTTTPMRDLGPGICLVELRPTDPLTPCLQSDVYTCCGHADLARLLSVSSRQIPQPTPANGTLMACDLGCRKLNWPARGTQRRFRHELDRGTRQGNGVPMNGRKVIWVMRLPRLTLASPRISAGGTAA